MARPSKYETEIKDKLILVEAWARNGLTNEQIAHNLGINVATLYEYQKQYPEFYNTLKKGKEVVDFEVENALLKRAMGYEYDEIVYENGKEVRRVRKQVLPDTTAQIFWLKNRKPVEWRDKHEIDQNIANKDGKPFEIRDTLSQLSVEELRKLASLSNNKI